MMTRLFFAFALGGSLTFCQSALACSGSTHTDMDKDRQCDCMEAGYFQSDPYKPDWFWVRVGIASPPGYDEWDLRWTNTTDVCITSTKGDGGAQPQTIAFRVGSTNLFYLKWRYDYQNWTTYPLYPNYAYYFHDFEVLYSPEGSPLFSDEDNAPYNGVAPYVNNMAPPDLSAAHWRYSSAPMAQIPKGDVEQTYGDPINLISRSMFFTEKDIHIPCPGFDLEFKRYYNSRLYSVGGGLGKGWTHSLNWRLLTYSNTIYRGKSAETWKVLSSGDDEAHWFPWNGTNWGMPFDRNWKLVQSTQDDFILSMPGGITCRFDTNGYATIISNMYGRSLAFTYTGAEANKLVSRVAHDGGLCLDLTYSNNLLTAVATPETNLSLRFVWNSRTNMTEAVRRMTEGETSISYRYNDNSTLTQRLNRVGENYNYTYSYGTNAYGQLSGSAMGMSVGSNRFYETAMLYGENGFSNQAGFVIGSSTQWWINIHDPISLQPTLKRSPEGHQTSYVKDADFNMIRRVESAPGGVIYTVTNRYDAAHRLIGMAAGMESDPEREWTLGWDESIDLLSWVEDPEGARVEYTYTNGLLARERLTDGTREVGTLFYYATNGVLEAVTNANGNGTLFKFDEWGRLNRIDNTLTPWVEFSNNRLGHVEQVLFQDGRVIRLDINELGWVKGVTWPDNSSESNFFDLAGNVTARVDRVGRQTKYEYLPGGKLSGLIREFNGTGVAVRAFYNQQMDTLRIQDERDRDVEAYSLDAEGRVSGVTNLEGQEMSVRYTVGGRPSWIGRFDGSGVTNIYGADGWLSEARYPGLTNRFGYLDNGLLVTAENDEGCVTNVYDGLNRLTNSAAVGPRGGVAYSYYPAGQPSNTSHVAGRLVYGLDQADRLELMASFAGDFNFAYNASNGLLESVTCTNNGLAVSYSYDLLDRVTGIFWSDGNGRLIRSYLYVYNATGLIEAVAREDGSQTIYGYDGLDRLVSEARRDENEQVLFEETINYDLVGNRTGKTRDSLAVVYGVENGNRLTGWSTEEAEWSLRLDVAGCADEEIGTGDPFGQLWVSNMISATPSVNGSNFLAKAFPLGLGTQQLVAAICDMAGNTTVSTGSVCMTVVSNAQYAYALSGCLTGIVYRGLNYNKTTTLEWDGRYQLTQAKVNGAAVEANGYDALGRRVWTYDGSRTNYFVYDGAHTVVETDSTGGLERAYVAGPGIDRWLAMVVYTGAAPRVYYYLTDHLGTVQAVVDEAGAVVESYRYDAWGRILGVYNANGAPMARSEIGNRILWQGREYSWNTGLYYFRARWYDPVTARWLSNDPIGISGGLNQYVFCGNNPVNFRDPLGLCTDDGCSGPEWRQRHWYDDVVGYFWQTSRNAVDYFGAPWINTYHAMGAYLENTTVDNACYLAQAYLPVVIGAGLSAQGSVLARSQGTIADDFLNGARNALGDGATIQRGPPGGSDFILRSADGTRQIRLDVTNPHGLSPHVNVETFAPRNAFPGDPRMIQTGNTHVFPGGQ